MLLSNQPVQGGYIALISSTVIAFALLAAAVALSGKSIMARFILLEGENKQMSEIVAFGCIEVARTAVANGSNYETAPIIIPTDDMHCTILSVMADTPTIYQTTIQTQATIDGATTNFETVIDVASLNIISQREVSSL